MTSAQPWLQILVVSIGAACGALLRWQTGLWLNMRWSGFPLGTLLVNCVGGLLIGVTLAWFSRAPPNELIRLLLVTGFLGGLTTFSSFSGETLFLLQRGQFGLALFHAVAHLLGALACAALGYWVVRAAFSAFGH